MKSEPRLRVDDIRNNKFVTDVLRKRLHRRSRPFRWQAKRWARRGNVYGVRLVGTPTDGELTFPGLFDIRGRLRAERAPPRIKVARIPVLGDKRSTGGFRRTFGSWRPQLRGAIREACSNTAKDKPLYRAHQAIYENGVIEIGLLAMAGQKRKKEDDPPVPLDAGQAVDAMALLIAWIAAARGKLIVPKPAAYLIEAELVAINRCTGPKATIRLALVDGAADMVLAARSCRFPRYFFPVLSGMKPFDSTTLLTRFERDLYHYCGLPVPSYGQFEVDARPDVKVARAA